MSFVTCDIGRIVGQIFEAGFVGLLIGGFIGVALVIWIIRPERPRP